MRTIFLISAFLFSTTMQASPGLKVGDKAPDISQNDIDNKSFNLKKATAKGPVVLVFYRGGWCPYCNTQLRDIEKKLLPEVKKHKGNVVAISVDNPKEGLKSAKENKLHFTILSDPDAKILVDYKVKFKVPEDLVKKYKNEYSIDVEAASGKKHHIIAIPAVFVVDDKLKVIFSYANEDYKVRAKIPDIIKALKTNKS